MNNLGDYDLYVKSDTHVFENFRNKYIEIYEPDHAHFLSVPGLTWQAYLKKKKKILELRY